MTPSCIARRNMSDDPSFSVVQYIDSFCNRPDAWRYAAKPHSKDAQNGHGALQERERNTLWVHRRNFLGLEVVAVRRH